MFDIRNSEKNKYEQVGVVLHSSPSCKTFGLRIVWPLLDLDKKKWGDAESSPSNQEGGMVQGDPKVERWARTSVSRRQRSVQEEVHRQEGDCEGLKGQEQDL